MQSKHDLKGKDQLLVLVRKYPEGLAVVEVKDAYPTVMEDLQVSQISYIMLWGDVLDITVLQRSPF